MLLSLVRTCVTWSLVAFLTLLAGCAGPTTKVAPTYSEAQLTQIQRDLPAVLKAQARLPELAEAIEAQEWQDAIDVIHGPFGDLRERLSRVTRSLLSGDQKEAVATSRALLDDLELVDAAAHDKNQPLALKAYDAAVRDFQTFLDELPAAVRPA